VMNGRATALRKYCMINFGFTKKPRDRAEQNEWFARNEPVVKTYVAVYFC
jgi:hypothetical protein